MLEAEGSTEQVIGCAMKAHRTLGAGFLESVYKRALALELRSADLGIAIEKPSPVFHAGEVVGDFSGDLIGEGFLIAELKAASSLSKADEQQLVNSLTATTSGYDRRINFGAKSSEFRRKNRRRSSPLPHPVNPRNPV